MRRMTIRPIEILALDSKDTLSVIQTDPAAFTQLASREVANQEIWWHVAVSGDTIYVRELEAFSAWRCS